jgi:hypothetical protein
VTEQTETPAWPDNIEFADIDELMREFHVFDPKMAECPHALLERIRTECPVGRSEKFDGYWVVTGVEPMRQVLGDPQTFSSTVPIIPRLSGADLSFAIPSGIDPPQHTQYRRLLGSVFSRKRIAALEPQLRQLARKLCDDFLAAEGPYDFKNGFATTLPCATLLAMLGLPYEDLDLGAAGGRDERSRMIDPVGRSRNRRRRGICVVGSEPDPLNETNARTTTSEVVTTREHSGDPRCDSLPDGKGQGAQGRPAGRRIVVGSSGRATQPGSEGAGGAQRHRFRNGRRRHHRMRQPGR